MDKKLFTVIYILILILIFWLGVLADRQYLKFVERVRKEAVEEYLIDNPQFINPRNFNYEQ